MMLLFCMVVGILFGLLCIVLTVALTDSVIFAYVVGFFTTWGAISLLEGWLL